MSLPAVCSLPRSSPKAHLLIPVLLSPGNAAVHMIPDMQLCSMQSVLLGVSVLFVGWVTKFFFNEYMSTL